MKYNYQPRLKIYHETLGKFDLLNKYNNVKSTFCKNTNIKVSLHFNEWVKTDLKKLIFKEFYLQQRFKYKKSLKKSENSFFVFTLRKKLIFLYLEMLLNSYFLNTNVKYKINPNISKTNSVLLTLSCQNKFFNFFNNSNNQFVKLKVVKNFKFKPTLCSEEILVNFSYYFLPTYTI